MKGVCPHRGCVMSMVFSFVAVCEVTSSNSVGGLLILRAVEHSASSSALPVLSFSSGLQGSVRATPTMPYSDLSPPPSPRPRRAVVAYPGDPVGTEFQIVEAVHG